MTKKVIIFFFLLSMAALYQPAQSSPVPGELLLKLPVRVLSGGETGFSHVLKLEKEDFELRIDGQQRPILEFSGKSRSIDGTRPGRYFALSFDVTGYGQDLSGAISHFIRRTVTSGDHLLVRSPLHIYKLNTASGKQEIINDIETNLEKDIRQYKENKTRAKEYLAQLIENFAIKVNEGKIGIRSITLFINHYNNEWNHFYTGFLAANPEKFSEIASRMTMADRKAEKWLIHFQEEDREIDSIMRKYREIAGKLETYVSSNAKRLGDQAGLIKDSLDKIEKSMRFPGNFPREELLDVLLGANLNFNALLLNPRDPGRESPDRTFPGYGGILGDIARETGGLAIAAANPAEAVEAVKKHCDFYYELVFKIDGSPVDKAVQVTLPGLAPETQTNLYYKKTFKKDELKWLMDWLAEKEIGISGYSLENRRLAFVISGFKRGNPGSRQPGPGMIRVDVRLIDSRQETVYETGNTLKTTGTSISISINLPDKYKGYYKLSATAGDLVSGKSFELKKYIKLD